MWPALGSRQCGRRPHLFCRLSRGMPLLFSRFASFPYPSTRLPHTLQYRGAAGGRQQFLRGNAKCSSSVHKSTDAKCHLTQPAAALGTLFRADQHTCGG